MHANTENIQGIFQNWRGEICNIRKYEHTKSEAFLFLYKIAACAWTGNGIFVSSLWILSFVKIIKFDLI